MISKETYKTLCSNINSWNTEYYVNNNPSVSDADYDATLKAIQDYEDAHPKDVIHDSPAWKVGGGRALHGLTSQQKMFSAEEVNAWWKKCGGGALIAEPKIDGCTLALDYHEGKLVKASLRDGGNGDNDVTNKAKYIDGIPQSIEYNDDIQIRGEVYMPYSAFNAINERQRLIGQQEYANPRNLCAGTMQADNPMLCKERGLKFMLWGWDKCDGVYYFDTKINLCELGFEHPGSWIIHHGDCKDVQHILDDVNNHRHEFDFPIDGIVFKIDNMSLWESIGVTGNHPKYQTAYKFPVESREVALKGIYYTVAKSGKITPNAEFECAKLYGTNVRHATLNNIKYMKDLLGDLRYGDKLIVTKANEIIPQVIGVKHVGTGDLVGVIDKCPMCGGPITHHLKQDGTYGVEDFCDNDACPSRTVIRTKSGKIASKATSISSISGGLEDTKTSVVVNLGGMYDTAALVGKSIVVSGTFAGEYSRKQLELMVEMCGGKLAGGVSKKTSFIVAGNDMGPSKRDKAIKFGVKIISDSDFIEMIKAK